MKFLLVLLVSILLISCERLVELTVTTSEMPLRQISQKEVTTPKGWSASYFLIWGNASSNGGYTTEKVRVFAKVEDYYQMIEIQLSQIRIHIVENLKVPYIKITKNITKRESVILNNKLVIDYNDYSGTIMHIYCNPEMLPEKLTAINL